MMFSEIAFSSHIGKVTYGSKIPIINNLFSLKGLINPEAHGTLEIIQCGRQNSGFRIRFAKPGIAFLPQTALL